MNFEDYFSKSAKEWGSDIPGQVWELTKGLKTNSQKVIKKAITDKVTISKEDMKRGALKAGSVMAEEIYSTFMKAFLNVEVEKEEKKKTGEAPGFLLDGDVLIGRALGEWKRAPVYLPRDDKRHKVVIGATGYGKTEFAKNVVVNRGQGICYLDNTDGTAVDDILRALPEDRLEDVVVLDHSNQEQPIGIGMFSGTGNLFHEDMLAGKWVSFFVSNFEIEGQYMTQELISYACKAVFGVEGTTLLDDTYSKARKYGLGIVSMFQSTKQVKKKSSTLLDIIFDNNPDLFAFHTSKKIEDYYNLDGFDPEDTPKYHYLAKIDGTKTFMAEAPGVLESKRKDISDILEAQREKFNQHYLKVHEQIERRWQRWEEGASTKEKSSESQVSGSRGSVNQGSPKETKSSSDMSHRIEL